MSNRPLNILYRTAIVTRWRLALILAIALAAFFTAPSTPARAQQSGITSPATGSAVGGDVPVIGTAVIDPFQKYELHYKLEPSGDDAYIYFDGGTTPVVNGQLAVWHAAGLAPGVYSLRLRVVKIDGNYAEYFAQNISVNQGPTPTPTSSLPTPTPIPTTPPTPIAQPTVVVGQVEQPGGDQPTAVPDQPSAASLPTPTPAAVAAAGSGDAGSANVNDAETPASLSRQLGVALSLERLKGYFFKGVRISAFAFLLIGAIFGGRWLFGWARRKYM
jgi:hypothetical protein